MTRPNMTPAQKAKRKWIIRLSILGVLLLGIWELFGLHITEPTAPVSVKKASSFANISIPSEATNIRIAGYRQWIEFNQFVRFEAPPAICLKTAEKILHDEKLYPSAPAEYTDFHGPLRDDVFKYFSWFDLRKAKNVVTGTIHGPETQVWVDQDRGIFYFCKSD